MSKYFRYFLLLIFFGTVFIIVFLQFNSNRSINRLIDGNEKLLNELNFKSELKGLQASLLGLDNKMRGVILRGQQINSDNLYTEIGHIETHLKKLQHYELDDTVQQLHLGLKKLVQEKVAFTSNVKDSFNMGASHAAALMILNTASKKNSDSITTICSQIDIIQQAKLTGLINKADDDGKRAKALGTIIALIAAIASFITFLYVSYKVRVQQMLIQKLNESELKVREAAKVKENFLANMSHEIRTPMNAILGFTSLLSNEPMSNQGKEYVRTINESGRKMLSLVNDILDLSKIESGMMRIDSSPFDIRAALHSVEELFSLQLIKKKIKLVTYVDPQVPATLIGDANRLIQVIINLVSNAVKFTNEGYITIKIEEEKRVVDKSTLRIDVEDTGIGIAEDKLHLLFERFHQADAAVTRQYGGTGLGLSIVKQLLEMQHGTIQISSTPGKGTLFTIMISYNLGHTSFEKKEINMPSANGILPNRKAFVLIVEDNTINQRLLHHWFQLWNVQYDIANNGAEAIEKLKINTYDLLLMDMQMPVMDGYAATKLIRNDLQLDVPIIAMTAHAMPGEKEKCLQAGMDDYVAKPLMEEDLKHMLLKYIGGEPLSSIEKGQAIHQYIDLSYLSSLSRGNKDYEKNMLELVITNMPLHITTLQQALKDTNGLLIKQEAHAMKSTISILGLDKNLGPHLNALEYENFDFSASQYHIEAIITIAKASIKEVQQLISQYK